MKRTKLILCTAVTALLLCLVLTSAFAANKGYIMTYTRGDVDFDEKLTTGDAVQILRYCAMPEHVGFNDLQIILADANANDNINAGDAVLVLRAVVGLAQPLYYDLYIEEDYTLEFDAAGGILKNTPEGMTDGKLTVHEYIDILPYLTGENAVSAEKDGYDFVGWAINGQLIDGTYASYSIEGNTTAVAVYEDYRVLTFDAGEGGTLINTPADMIDGKLTFHEPTEIISYLVGENAVKAKKSGFSFAGWSIDGKLIDETYASYTLTTSKVAVAVYEELEDVNLNIEFYDGFNGLDLNLSCVQPFAPKTFVLTGDMVTLPDGYHTDADFSVRIVYSDGEFIPSTVTVKVYPYTIIDDEEYKIIYTLMGLRNVQNDMNFNYIMGADVDMGSTSVFTPFGWDWSNYDVPETPFTGIFEGDGHTITNLHIDFTMEWVSDTEYNYYANVGLFSINEGIIKNLNIYTRPFTGDLNYGVYGDVNVGILAGYNQGTIYNCHTYGNVGSLFYVDQSLGAVGGICGTNGENAYVIRSSFEGGVEGFFFAGGVSGKNFGTIDQCYFAGGINWDVDPQFAYDYSIRYIGGVVGGGQMGTLSNSYAYLTYNIRADYAVGGIMGWIQGGKLENCYIAGVGGIQYVSGYGGEFIGYTASGSTHVMSGVYNFNLTTGLPAEYSSTIWDMGGAQLPAIPDLVKNRRSAVFYDAIAD